MQAAILKDIGWTTVLALAVIFGAIIGLALIWSKREWNTRKIRMGVFLEREYRTEEDDAGVPDSTAEAETQRIRHDEPGEGDVFPRP